MSRYRRIAAISIITASLLVPPTQILADTYCNTGNPARSAAQIWRTLHAGPSTEFLGLKATFEIQQPRVPAGYSEAYMSMVGNPSLDPLDTINFGVLWRAGQTWGTVHYWIRRKDGSVTTGDLGTFHNGDPAKTLEIKIVLGNGGTLLFNDEFWVDGVKKMEILSNTDDNFQFTTTQHLVVTTNDVTQIMGGTLDWFKITNAWYTSNWGTASFGGVVGWSAASQFFSVEAHSNELWTRDNACLW